MPVDPRLNCAAEICCPPKPAAPGSTSTYNTEAHKSRIAILADLGLPADLAEKVSREMVSKGLVFLSAELAAAVREIAFP